MAAALAFAFAFAFADTGLAWLLLCHLIANVDPANDITVDFLMPLLAVLWEPVFLGEVLTPEMGVRCFVILLGTGLTAGRLRWPRRPAYRLTSSTDSTDPHQSNLLFVHHPARSHLRPCGSLAVSQWQPTTESLDEPCQRRCR